ncbi:MAG: nucleotidyltransferase family protein [Desulfuromonadales bacterium]|nr:nucleotidyltransferase family protein [Desulfuromonadales bacterium]
MSKQDILDIIRQLQAEMANRYGVDRMGLFGSFARGEECCDSDIDILVSFRRDIDLFEFVDLKEYLQERLDHKVDLVMESALKPTIGKRIRAEVEYV